MSGLAEARRTGNRARGTQLKELRNLYDRSISARAIFEDLECRRPADPADEVATYMAEQSFDVMGVRAEDQHPTGFVKREELNGGRCEDHLEHFSSANLIADSTPLVTVLSTLRDRPYVFILQRDQVSAIVTRADLQKPAVRMYLFSLVTLFEMHMGALVRRHYEDDSWKDELSTGRIKNARDFQEKRRKRNEELPLRDCLQFCDKRELVLAREAAREVLGIPSKNKGTVLLKAAEELRDNLSHAQKLAKGSGWPGTIDLVMRVEEMIERSEDEFA